MKAGHLTALALAFCVTTAAWAANPFLSAADDKPVSAKFRGAEWGDNIAQEEISLSVRVVTTRIAKMSWGEVYKIAFTDIASSARNRREITQDYFIATDDRIVLLNEEKIGAAVKKLVSMEKPPDFAQSDIYGITEGKVEFTDGPWETTIELKDDLCIYQANHNSGHFKKVVWRKGVGLVEYSMGYGAMADGFRLKRIRTN
ncbi:MAG TPA: hypothetical protein VGG94_02925 [Chthoniobacterales bacterium]|jgi:hypothetical protein